MFHACAGLKGAVHAPVWEAQVFTHVRGFKLVLVEVCTDTSVFPAVRGLKLHACFLYAVFQGFPA